MKERGRILLKIFGVGVGVTDNVIIIERTRKDLTVAEDIRCRCRSDGQRKKENVLSVKARKV